MARPREYDDDLRMRLIEEAARLLAEDGPASLTTRRVAAAVGTSTTAIYSLIGSKDDLVQAVCAEGFARLAAHLATVEPTEDPLDDLHRLSHAYVDMALENPTLYLIMFGQRGPAITRDDERPGVETLQTSVAMVQRAIDAGLFAGDAFELAVQFWALGHGVASLAITGMLGGPGDVRRVLDDAGTAMALGALLQGALPEVRASLRERWLAGDDHRPLGQ